MFVAFFAVIAMIFPIGAQHKSLPGNAWKSSDLVLSSGYLAFARHCGVVSAIEDWGISIDKVVGTSSGSLVGSLFASGYKAQQIYDELGSRTPIELLSFDRRRVNRGLFSLKNVEKRLSVLLPKDFKDLEKPLGSLKYFKITNSFMLM